METKYGIISDIHRAKPHQVFDAIYVLKNEGIDKLVLNGDLVGDQNQDITQTDFFEKVLNYVAQSKIETYIQPGSHEEKTEFGPMINVFSEKYHNIIDLLGETNFKQKDHHLAFIPGSNVIAGKVEEGYITSVKGFNKNLKDPEKTIVFSHVPRRFNNIDQTVDYAFFAQFSDGSFGPAQPIMQKINNSFGDISLEKANEILQINNLELKEENRGSQKLKQLFEINGINKCVSGHFHESVHRANDSAGNYVKQGEFTNELNWNASYLDEGKIGVLRVIDNKVAYKNLKI